MNRKRKFVALFLLLVYGCDTQAEWLYSNGLDALASGDHQKARGIFMRLSQDYPSHPHASTSLLHRARILWMQEQKLEAAEVAYLDLMREYPDTEESRTALRELIDLLAEQPDKRPRALQMTEHFIQRYPQDAYLDELVQQQADLFIALGNIEQALLELERITQKRPSFVQNLDLQYKRQQLLYLAQKYEIVLEESQPLAVRAQKKDQLALASKFLFLAALAHEEQGQIEAAIEILFRIENDYPNPRAISEKIVALQERKNERKR